MIRKAISALILSAVLLLLYLPVKATEAAGSISVELEADSVIGLYSVEGKDISVRKLERMVSGGGLSGKTEKAGADGTAVFENLGPGLYFICQETPGLGNKRICPFFVAVPTVIAGEEIWHIDARPKMQEIVPEEIPAEKLPQTGQLKWPAAAMAVSGGILLAAGHYQKKKNQGR